MSRVNFTTGWIELWIVEWTSPRPRLVSFGRYSSSSGGSGIGSTSGSGSGNNNSSSSSDSNDSGSKCQG